MKVGDRYKTNNYGSLEIIGYEGICKVLVKFINTGYITTAIVCNIRKGQVRDSLKPSVRGVGYLGDGKYNVVENGNTTLYYKKWSSMLRRCYCKRYINKNPTYIGCTVCKEWLNFQIFAKWLDDQRQPSSYQLDKDIKVKDNKLYSPKTCLLVSPLDNIIKANAKYYKFLSPGGIKHNIYNLTDFCRKNKLTNSAMVAVNLNKRNHHKGWTKYYD